MMSSSRTTYRLFWWFPANKGPKHVGYFDDDVEAAKARDVAVMSLRGRPKLNFPAHTYFNDDPEHQVGPVLHSDWCPADRHSTSISIFASCNGEWIYILKPLLVHLPYFSLVALMPC